MEQKELKGIYLITWMDFEKILKKRRKMNKFKSFSMEQR